MDLNFDLFDTSSSHNTSESKSETSSVLDEVSSTVDSVAESIGAHAIMCGVEVTLEFLEQLDQVLREHLHRVRLAAERDAELMRVNRECFQTKLELEFVQD
jgi:hypothetical protein